jgi:dTMP kinase
MNIMVAFNLIYSMIQRGKFIVLEGLDRSGKSSLAKYIRELISQQHRAEKGMNFPDRDTPIGKMINDFLTQKTELSN